MRSRPFGVTLVALFFFLKGVALAAAAVIAHTHPELRSSAITFVAGVAPISREFGARFIMTSAPFVAALELAFALGLWFLNKWAWAWLIVIYGTGVALVAGIIIVSSFDHAFSSLLPHSAYFSAGVILEAVVVVYLLTPDAKGAFSGSE